jgi:ferredoxin-NADP reductase
MAQAQEFICSISENRPLTPTVFQLSVHLPRSIVFQAGQFASLVIPGRGPNGRDLRRAYSIASAPQDTTLQFCIKTVDNGPGSTYLRDLKAGSPLTLHAPYGTFVYKTPPDKKACFIATGTGISPFRSMIFSNAYREAPPTEAWCLQGVREDDELLYVDELRSAEKLRFVTAVSRPKKTGGFDFTGRVTDYLRAHASEIAWGETDFYLCGNGAMIDEIKRILTEKSVQKGQIHQEVYYKPKNQA